MGDYDKTNGDGSHVNRGYSSTNDYDIGPDGDAQVNTEPKVNGVHVVTSTEPDIYATDPNDDLPCKWGPVKPSCLQFCRSPKAFLFFICWAGAIQGMVVNGFVSVVISTLERRFDLTSTQSGVIPSAYDIASVLCLVPVSYFGGTGSKPRWLGFGVLLMGLGSFVFSLPHFITGPYQFLPSQEVTTCVLESQNISACSVNDGYIESNANYIVLIIGQLLHGAGATPLYTLGVTYFDENLKSKMTPVYVGIFYAMAIVGPAIGYLLGGYTLEYFCDMDSLDADSILLTIDSPKWVGAWWIGFLLSGSLAVIFSIPILGFPKFLPGTAKIRSEKVSEAHQSKFNTSKDSQDSKEKEINSDQSKDKDSPKKIVKEGPKKVAKSAKKMFYSLRILLTNPTFMFLNLAGASEGLLLSGFAAFTPKYLEYQYSISASWAAMLVGIATIPFGGGGTFLGGYLVKRFNLKCRGIIKMCLVTTSVSLVLVLVFLSRCQDQPFAGINVDYAQPNVTLKEPQFTSQCNSACDCDARLYEPVCGTNDVMYLSPCHAGCTNSTLQDGTEVYLNCSCVGIPHNESVVMAVDGKCESGCLYLWLFLAFFAIIILATFTTSMPALSATLRCVPDEEKSFALGIQWILVRCLGTIPAPILFGALIDDTCQLWQSTCSGQGSCYFYNNTQMGLYLMGISIGGKCLSFLFFILALCLYKPPPEVEEADDVNKNKNINKSADDQNTNSNNTMFGGGDVKRSTDNVGVVTEVYNDKMTGYYKNVSDEQQVSQSVYL